MSNKVQFVRGSVSLRESDVSRLAQAKAANVAGLQIVLKRFGIDVDDLLQARGRSRLRKDRASATPEPVSDAHRGR